MNLGIICDIVSNTPVGTIAVDQLTGTAAYLTSNEVLDKTIDVILANDELPLMIPEEIDGRRIVRSQKLDTYSPQYLVAFNYQLPYPWRIMALKYEEGDIEDIVKKCYDCMEV